MNPILLTLLVLAVVGAFCLYGMALTTEPNLRQTNSAYNNLAHEDLMDVLDRVDPAATPVWSMATRENELGNTEFSWEVDSWPNPNGAVGPGDGYATQAGEVRDVAANRRKMGNYGQAFRRVFGAGWIANQVPDLPGKGKGKLLADGAADAMILLKQDFEVAACSFDQTATPDVGGASGSIMAGIVKLVDPTNAYTHPSGFAYGKPTDLHTAPASAVVTGAMATAFNLAATRTVVQALRVATKVRKDYAFLCGLDLRAAVTALIDPIVQSASGGALAATQTRNFTQRIDDAQLGMSIDVIRTDYGRLLVMDTDHIGNTTTNSGGTAQTDANRSLRVYVNKATYGLILSREKLFKRVGVPVQPGELADDGGGTTRYVRTYLSIGVRNPVGFGYFKTT